MKTCRTCAEPKPEDAFSPARRECKACRSAKARARQAAWTPAQRAAHTQKVLDFHKTEKGKVVARKARLKHRYGITVDQYMAMLEAQGGHCYFCPAEVSPYNRRLSVDHDHQTGKVRGILCLNCNNKMAFIDEVGLDKIREYLSRSC